MSSPSVVVGLLLLTACATANGGTFDHRYKQGAPVDLWVNTVGPFANPQETYEFYALAYCVPKTEHHSSNSGRFKERKVQSIGEYLGGHALRHSGYDIIFDPPTYNHTRSAACETMPLTDKEADKFGVAIRNQWFYQMYLDDLPIWGMVGEMLPADEVKKVITTNETDETDEVDKLDHTADQKIVDLKPHLYTSRTLTISFNGDRIVQVELTSDPKSMQQVKPGAQLNFELRVTWEASNENFHSRFERYVDHEFFHRKLRWVSIVNPLLLPMGLFVVWLLRNLKKDYARYSLIRDTEDANGNTTDDGSTEASGMTNRHADFGWKQVHGDVFRAPSRSSLFAGIIGCGWQLVTVTLGVLSYAVVMGRFQANLHEKRGAVIDACLIWYVLSSGFAGYQSGHVWNRCNPKTTDDRLDAERSTSLWHVPAGLAAMLIPGTVVPVLSVLEIVAWSYGTTYDMPYTVIIKLFFMWIFISVPCCAAGSYLASRYAQRKRGGDLSGSSDRDVGGANGFPCPVHDDPRPIPIAVSWYGKPRWLIPLAGLFIFASISVELHCLFLTFWHYNFYVMYGFLLGVNAILVVVVSITSVVVVYLVLNAENWQWRWTAFGCGASTGVYVFLYSIYYFLAKTSMHGIVQTSFYFGYSVLIAVHLGWMCGTIAHASSSAFVHTIFKNLKVD